MRKALTLFLIILLSTFVTSCSPKSEACNSKVEDCISVLLDNKLEYSPVTDDLEEPEPTVVHRDGTSAENDIAEEDFEQRLYSQAKEMYLSGEWDGLPITMEGRVVSICPGSGYLLFDGYIADGQEVLDFPEDFTQYYPEHIFTYEYIPGHGTYAIVDGLLVKYLRGQETILSENELEWKGYNPHHPENSGLVKYGNTYYIDADPDRECDAWLYKPYLWYDSYSDNLFLVTYDIRESKQYLYLFPNKDQSKMELVDAVSHLFATSMDCLYYTDTDGQLWKYEKDGPVKVDDFE